MLRCDFDEVLEILEAFERVGLDLPNLLLYFEHVFDDLEEEEALAASGFFRSTLDDFDKLLEEPLVCFECCCLLTYCFDPLELREPLDRLDCLLV